MKMQTENDVTKKETRNVLIYPIFDYAQIILDTETNGILPNSKVVEIGAVAVDENGNVLDEFEILVYQPRELLYGQRYEGAFSVNGIDREEILQYGIPEAEAGREFANWIFQMKRDHGVKKRRAFNQQFDFGKLARHPIAPWVHEGGSLPDGRCLMLSSMPSMISSGTAVLSPQWVQDRCDSYGLSENDIERYKWPSAEEAEEHFKSLGYRFPREIAHRALPDAKREAALAVAIRLEELNRGL